VRRAGTILLVLFQAFWLNVVVPGHTRGAVTLPGSGRSGHALAHAGGCCAAAGGAGSRHGKKAPTADDRARCAICSFAASLSAPPAVDTTLLPLGLSHVLPPVEARSVAARHVTLAYDGRGPPLG
jgi:hypothetical protein